MDNLPVELVLIIFHKVPVKSIGQSMCVSKKWLSLIKNPHFISTYTIASRNVPSNQLLVYQESKKKLSFNFDEPGFNPYKLATAPFVADNWSKYLRGICKGLLCIVDRQGAIVLWNPIIQKTLTIPCFSPKPNLEWHLFVGLAFDSLTNDYKVVTYVKHSHYAAEPEPDYLQVFSLNRNSWRRLSDRTITPRYYIQNDSISFNSVIHWIGMDNKVRFILGFDASSEVVQVMKLPQSVAEKSTFYLKISVYKDYTIGVCHSTREHTEIWVMMEYGNVDSWNRMWTFRIGESLNIRQIGRHPLSFCFRKSGELFLQVCGYDDDNEGFQRIITLLDPRSRENKVVAKGLCYLYGKVISYFEESLILLDHPSAESVAF